MYTMPLLGFVVRKNRLGGGRLMNDKHWIADCIDAGDGPVM